MSENAPSPSDVHAASDPALPGAETPGAEALGEDAETKNAVSTETVLVDTEALVVGRTNRFPIHDERGVLLLAADQVLTERFKRKLRNRNIRGVRLNAEDAASIAFVEPPVVAPPPVERPPGPQRHRRFDAAVQSGMPYVTNSGPALMERVVDHGTEGYDPDHQRELGETKTKLTGRVARMMFGTTRGRSVNEGQVIQAADAFMESLIADCDSTLSMPFTPAVDEQLADQCLRMATLGMAIGTEMGLNEENVRRIGVAGLLHDWGMVRVPESIRNKKTEPTRAERLEIEKHPAHTVNMLEKTSGLPSLVPLVAYQVHERMDGTGYPRGRRGNGIHLFARILHVADQFVALTTPTPYRRAYSPYAAMRTILKEHAAGSSDPLALRGLLHATSLFPVGSYVTLSDSSVARVLRSNHEAYATPIVQIVQDAEGRSPGDSLEVVNLSDTDLQIVQALPTPGRSEIHYVVHDHGLQLEPHITKRGKGRRRQGRMLTRTVRSARR